MLLPSLSPDGKQALYNDASGAMAIDLASGSVHPVNVPPLATGWRDQDTVYFVEPGKEIGFAPLAGGGPTQLLETPHVLFPSFSHDGKRMAYVDGATLFIANPDGTRPRQLLGGAAFSLVAWSPDDRWLAVGYTLQDSTFRLSVVTPDGREVPVRAGHDIHDDFGNVSTAWVGNDRLLYPSYSGGATELLESSFDPTIGALVGAPVSRGVFPGIDVKVISATSDGREVLATFTVQQSEIRVIDLSGDKASEPRSLPGDHGRETPLGFSDDASLLYVATPENHAAQILAIDTGSGHADPIASVPEHSTFSSGDLAFLQEPGNLDGGHATSLDVFMLDPRSKQTRHLGQVPAQITDLILCPRMNTDCVIVQSPPGHVNLRTWSAAGGVSSNMTGLDSTLLHRVIALSPDGRRLAVTDGRNPLGIYETSSFKETAKIDTPFLAQQVAWVSDRELVVVGMGAAPAYKLIRVSLNAQEQVTLFETGDGWIGNPVVSPDGKHVAFTQENFTENLWLLER
jgi:WD40 repeat protein